MRDVSSDEELAAFLDARLDEAQRDAEAMEHDRDWDDDYRSCLAARIGTMADKGYAEADCNCGLAERKARALREVEAKRAILSRYERGTAGDLPEWKAGRELIEAGLAILLAVLRDLAAIDRDHPDYRPEWKP